MIKVEFLGPLGNFSREFSAEKIKNLNDLKEILKGENEISQWLENCAVAVNGEIAKDIQKPLQDGDTIALLPPVCGG